MRSGSDVLLVDELVGDVVEMLIAPGAPREAQEIFPIKLVNDDIDLLRNSRVMNGLKFSLLNGIDPNLNNVSGPFHQLCANTRAAFGTALI